MYTIYNSTKCSFSLLSAWWWSVSFRPSSRRNVGIYRPWLHRRRRRVRSLLRMPFTSLPFPLSPFARLCRKAKQRAFMARNSTQDNGWRRTQAAPRWRCCRKVLGCRRWRTLSVSRSRGRALYIGLSFCMGVPVIFPFDVINNYNLFFSIKD